MGITSPMMDLPIPQTDILSHLFGHGQLSDQPVWIDAADVRNYLSPRTMLQWVKRLAVGLDRLGVKPGETIMICSPNHIFVPALYLGVVGSGRVFSGANPTFTADELAFQIRDSSPQLCLVHPSLLQTARIALQRAGVPEQCLYMFSDGENQPVDGIRDWHSLLGTSEEAENYRWPRLGAESTQKIAAINYSSGTTGFPKGVMITHYNLIANVEQVSSSTRGLAYTTSPSAERWISFLPLYHAFGQLFTCLLAAKLLIPVYIMKTFVFEDFLRLIETHKITDMQVAPPILVMLSKRPETSRYDLSSLKTIASGAAPLSKELQAMCAERYNVIITQGWGMTELTSAGTSSRVGIENCGGSIGMLLPNCEARLLDEDGNEVKPHERGEIFIRGPNVSVGYWRNEEATRQAMLPDGWFRTGDIATHDETGRLWIVDRLKELIKVNGFQVAPAELEATLLKHDSIADAAVVGITIAGEEWPRAYVALKDSAKGNVQPADIQHWIQARVAKHKRLQGGVVFVDMVPKSASGKIQRKIMSEWAKNDAMKMETMQFKARL